MAIGKMTEIVIGVYALGAVGQGPYLLRRSRKFYRDMADRAWLRPAERVIEKLLLPNSVTVMTSISARRGRQ